MRTFHIHQVTVYSRQLGAFNVQLDLSQGDGSGHWRQKAPYNNQIASAGNFKWLMARGTPHTLYLYDSTSFFAKPVVVMDHFYTRPGLRGSGKLKTSSGTSDAVWGYMGSQKVEEWTIQDLAATITDSTWRIVGSRGISYGVGKGVTVEGSTGSIFVKGDSEAANAEHELVYSTAGLGAGWGTELPIVVSGSTKDMPSGGIGTIYTKRRTMSLLDFEGICGIVEVNGALGRKASLTKDGKGGGAGLYFVMFGNGTWRGLASWGLMWGTFASATAGAAKGMTGNVGGAMTLGTCVVMN